MKLLTYCPACQTTHELGDTSHLPQPSVLLGQIADIHHGHKCPTKVLDIAV